MTIEATLSVPAPIEASLATPEVIEATLTPQVERGSDLAALDARYDLGCTPLTVSDSLATAQSNSSKLNAYFASHAQRRRPLKLLDSFGVDDTIQIPAVNGVLIECLGATDLRGESEYKGVVGGGTDLGGNPSRLMRIGSNLDPIIASAGLGLNVTGTLVLEGYYESGTRTDKHTNIRASAELPVGLLVEGNDTGTIGTGKGNIQGLTGVGLEATVQFSEGVKNESDVTYNNADNTWINKLSSWFCREGIRIYGGQSVSLAFGFVGGWQCDNLVVAGRPNESHQERAGGKVSIQHAAMVQPFTTGGIQTLFTVNSCTRTTAQYNCHSLVIDNMTSPVKPRLAYMPETFGANNLLGGPAQFNIYNGHNSNTTAMEPSLLRDNAALNLFGFYYLNEDFVNFEASATEKPSLNMFGCRWAVGKHPQNAVNSWGTQGDGSAHWYGCQDHNGGDIVDGRVLDNAAAQFLQYA